MPADDRGALDCVPKVDAKNKGIKELYRAVTSTLSWKLPIFYLHMDFNLQ